MSAKQANEAFNDHKTMQTKPKYTKTFLNTVTFSEMYFFRKLMMDFRSDNNNCCTTTQNSLEILPDPL